MVSIKKTLSPVLNQMWHSQLYEWDLKFVGTEY